MSDRVQMHASQVDYCVKTYALEKVRPHAAACRAGQCKTYNHCFGGTSHIGAEQLSVTPNVCADTIERKMLDVRPSPGRIEIKECDDGGFRSHDPFVHWSPLDGTVSLDDYKFTLEELMWIVEEIKRRRS